jgi:hypothetical protein
MKLHSLQLKLEEEKRNAKVTIEKLQNNIHELEIQVHRHRGRYPENFIAVQESKPHRQLISVTKQEVLTYEEYQEEKDLRTKAESFAAAMATRAKAGLELKSEFVDYILFIVSRHSCSA